MTTVNGSNGAAGVGQIDLSSMDLETALMMVQGERVKLLDAQFQNQISQLNQLNDRVNALRTGMLSSTGQSADNVHMHHMKEVVDALDRIVRDENIDQVEVVRGGGPSPPAASPATGAGELCVRGGLWVWCW